MTPGSPMLTELNTGDETPDDVSWTAYVSWCELVILPTMSDLLDGADNHYLSDRCVLHDDWKEDVATAREVVATFSGSAMISA